MVIVNFNVTGKPRRNEKQFDIHVYIFGGCIGVIFGVRPKL